MEKTTRVRKWIPCPVYDVEAMESWLGDLAAQGWFLEEDGIFGPWAYFLPGPPRPAAYRLTSSLSSPDFTGPEEENQELCAAYGWEYLARRGAFFIYRAVGADVRELDTDPQTQALVLRAVCRRTLDRAAGMVVVGLITPLFLQWRDGTLDLLLQYPGYWAVPFAVVLWFLGLVLVGCRHYRRLRRHLQEGRPLDHQKPWQPGARRRLACVLVTALLLGLLVVWLVVGLTVLA